MNVSDAIRLKRAVRKFTSDPLPEETITAILNAGRRAQSSKNTQPWHWANYVCQSPSPTKRF